MKVARFKPIEKRQKRVKIARDCKSFPPLMARQHNATTTLTVFFFISG